MVQDDNFCKIFNNKPMDLFNNNLFTAIGNVYMTSEDPYNKFVAYYYLKCPVCNLSCF
jgi:hypothetical protein